MCGSEPWPEKGHSGADRFRAGEPSFPWPSIPKKTPDLGRQIQLKTTQGGLEGARCALHGLQMQETVLGTFLHVNVFIKVPLLPLPFHQPFLPSFSKETKHSQLKFSL